MDQQGIYVAEKLKELEASRRHPPRTAEHDARRKMRPLAPVIGSAGRRVRGFGEALERWASPVLPRDAAR